MCTVDAVQDQICGEAGQHAFCGTMTMMPRPDVYQASPLQLDFSGAAARITSSTATPIKQKVCK
jgi:hypothetical protein